MLRRAIVYVTLVSILTVIFYIGQTWSNLLYTTLTGDAEPKFQHNLRQFGWRQDDNGRWTQFLYETTISTPRSPIAKMASAFAIDGDFDRAFQIAQAAVANEDKYEALNRIVSLTTASTALLIPMKEKEEPVIVKRLIKPLPAQRLPTASAEMPLGDAIREPITLYPIKENPPEEVKKARLLLQHAADLAITFPSSPYKAELLLAIAGQQSSISDARSEATREKAFTTLLATQATTYRAWLWFCDKIPATVFAVIALVLAKLGDSLFNTAKERWLDPWVNKAMGRKYPLRVITPVPFTMRKQPRSRIRY